MAKLHEELVVLKLSKLVKEKDDGSTSLADDEICGSLEQVVQELLGDSIIVEIERA